MYVFLAKRRKRKQLEQEKKKKEQRSELECAWDENNLFFDAYYFILEHRNYIESLKESDALLNNDLTEEELHIPPEKMKEHELYEYLENLNYEEEYVLDKENEIQSMMIKDWMKMTHGVTLSISRKSRNSILQERKLVNDLNDGDEMPFFETKILQFDNLRLKTRDIINRNFFQGFIITLIIINSILMGVNTYLPNPDKDDSNDISDGEQKALDVITAVDKLFLLLFTIELGMNLFVHLHYFVKDAWIVFDFFTIATSYAFSGVTIMRSFRIFRVFRLFGRIKSLKLVVDAVGSTAENFTSIMAVLLIILYIFAVMFTQLFSKAYEMKCFAEERDDGSIDLGIDYYGRLDKSLFTLLLFMTFDDFGSLIRVTECDGEFWFASWVILPFMFVSGFALLNLVIAVLCEALNVIEQQHKQKVDDVMDVDNINVDVDEIVKKNEYSQNVYLTIGGEKVLTFSSNDTPGQPRDIIYQIFERLHNEKEHIKNLDRINREFYDDLTREYEAIYREIIDLKEIAQ